MDDFKLNEQDYQLRVTMSKRQLHLLIKAVDMFTRMGIGQLEEVADTLNYLFSTGHHRFDNYNPIMSKMKEIKTSCLHQPLHGTTAFKTHVDVETLVDFLRCLQKGVATAEEHHFGSVWHHGDILHYGDQPTPVVEIIREEIVIPVEVKQHRKS